MSNDIIVPDAKDIETNALSNISQFLGNKDCNNDLYLQPIPNDVDDLLTCIETWKKDNPGSNPDNLDNLILSEKLLENDELINCDKSDSTTVSDGCDEINGSNFGEIINDDKSDKIINSPLDNNTPTDTNTLLTVEDILYSPINNSYDNELYNKKTEVLPNPLSYYDYSPINKKSSQTTTNDSNNSNKQNIDMKVIEEAAASSEKVRGVCFCKSDKSWTAWWTEKGRNRKKAFKLSIYGFEEARRLAIAHRKAVENRIPELKYKNNATKVKPSKRQVNRFPRVLKRQIHNINDEVFGNESYNDISSKIIFNDKKRNKFCHYYKSPYPTFESIRECSTAEDSQIPSPLTSKTSMETLENDMIHNHDNITTRSSIYTDPGKLNSLDKMFTDIPRGVTYNATNQTWCTQWCNNNGAPCIKTFSVSNYGFDKARAMAIEHRRMLESTDQIGSRVPGVFFKDNAWCATWTDINGKRNFRSFPIGPNMTYDDARRIAIACKKNATNDTELTDSGNSKVNLELQDLYKLATCTLDVEIDDNINVEQNLQKSPLATNNVTYPHINNINKSLNNNIGLNKMQKMMYNTENLDYMYNKWTEQSSAGNSQLIKEVPLQRQVANHLSRILLSNQIELQNIVNIRFLVGNGLALQQLLSNNQAKNKVFGLVLMTRDAEL